jgi:FkbM family methyltransferase
MMKNFLRSVYRKYKSLTVEKPLRFYQIDGFMMDMGENHNLSLHQKNFPLYDKIIPYLTEMSVNENHDTTEKRWIIDIGANVGDTVAAMIRHTNANILCVEPTKLFYSLLKKNIANFGEEYSNKIRCENCYIAMNSEEKYISNQMGGTAVKEKIALNDVAEASTLTLANLLDKENIQPNCVDLIKVDTDGYDSECIMSLGSLLSQMDAFLYWENQIDTQDEFEKYIQLATYLRDMGYVQFFLFDNFGNYLCEGDIDVLKDINNYLMRCTLNKSARTFYYVDILACKLEKKEICRKMIKTYNMSI